MKIRQRSLCLIALAALTVLLPTAVPEASAQTLDFTIDPASPQIKLGNPVQVTITATEPILVSDVTWSDGGAFVKDEGKTQVSETKVVTTLQALEFSATPVTMKVTVKGREKPVQVTTLTTVSRSDFPSDLGDTVEAKQNEAKFIRLNTPPDLAIPDGALDPVSDNPSVTAEARGSSIVITGRAPGSARITIKSNGQSIKTLLVNVSEVAKAIESNTQIIRITVATPLELSSLHTKVIGKAGGDLTTQFPPNYDTDNSAIAKVSNGQLIAIRTPRAGDLAPNLKISAGGLTTRIPIDVVPALEDLTLTAPGTRAVSIGQPVRIDAQVLDSDKQLQTIPDIEWSLSNPADSAFLDLQPHGSYATVTGIFAHNDVRVSAKIRNSTLAAKVVSFDVKDRTVQGFTLLRIRIDLLDSQTAKDLFGKKANDEFYIAKIRLFNKAKNANDEFGDSILVYSESLEISVQLQMKGANGWQSLDPRKTLDPATNKTVTEYEKYFGPPYNPFDGKQACRDPIQPNFDARYRPYTFDIVANTHDRRDERSTRSRILTVANGISSLASFVTAIAVPGPSSDLPLGLEKFKNLLIPSFEKLFPSMREVQRQNIISMVIRPLEEIPFGSDITRILFIPKGKLIGMISDKVFRIGGVSTTGACAEVGIIKKTGSTQ